MRELLQDLIENIIRRMPDMDFASVVEIFIISFLIYHILVWIKNTRAWALLKALGVMFFFWIIAYGFHMTTILFLGRNIMSFAVIAFIVVMQPELRKALEELGNIFGMFSVGSKPVKNVFTKETANEITKACVEMSKVKTGALIVIECKQTLGDFLRTGIDVDGIVSSQLLINIFEHNTPLHDGAVIVQGNRVASATCYLPLSDNTNLDKTLGTRHRAGVGISEVTDAVVVIVSEETGRISVAYKGELDDAMDREGEKLKEKLKLAMPESAEEVKKSRKIWKGRSRADKVGREKVDSEQNNE